MPLVKGPVREVLVEAEQLVLRAQAAVSQGTACSGAFFGIGRDQAACFSVAQRVEKVRQHLLKLRAETDAIDESKKTAPSEAQRVVNLVKLYADELRYHIRESKVRLQFSLEPDFEWLSLVIEAVTKQLAQIAVKLGEGAGKIIVGAGKGLADGLGPFGLLVLAATIYYGQKGAFR